MSTITVDSNQSFQTMIGWEATSQAGEDTDALTDTYPEYPSDTFPNYKDDLLDAMLDLGLNRFRVEFNIADINATGYDGNSNNAAIQPSTATSGQFHYDRVRRTMDEVIIPYRTMMQAQGETPYLVLNMVDFRNSGYHAEDIASEFALAFKKFMLDWYTRYGFLPDACEVLEPDNSDGNQNWSAADLANGIVAAQAAFEADGTLGPAGASNIKWIAPSVTTLGNATTWIADMKTAQASIASYIQEYSYHLYGGNDTDLANLKSVADADGKTTAMTESHVGFGGVSADHIRLYKDVVTGGNSSWEQYVIAYPYPGATDDGGAYFQVNTSTWAVTPSNRTKYLRHWFKYVRRGAVRKGVSNVGGNGLGVPFRLPNGKYVVVVKYTGSDTTTISGLPAGTYGIRYTTGDGTSSPSAYDQTISNQTVNGSQDVTFSMPGAGIATVYDINFMQYGDARVPVTVGALPLVVGGIPLVF